MKLPYKTAGDPILLKDFNKLIEAINRQKIVAGPGIVTQETASGTLVSIDPAYLKQMQGTVT